MAISETGSFGAAGEKVNKTQSTVSAQMKRLEEIVGVNLFEKEGRRNILTVEGHKLLEYAASMVRLNDEALHAFRPPEVTGNIKVGAIDEYAQAFFPEVLDSFTKAQPGVLVSVTTSTSTILKAGLAAGEFDAVFVSCHSGDADIELLRIDQLHWIGGEGHNLHYNDPLPLAAWSEGCSWREMAQAALAKHGRSVRLAFSTSNAALMTTTLKRGLGVTVAPRWFVSEGLRVIEELDAKCPLGRAEIGVKRKPGTNPAREAFIAHLQQHLRLSALAA
nr:LysR family transcriptional regulator [Pelagibacterium limicola]